MRKKKFPFFTVPFVAQWYYNGQSVPFRLYILFRLFLRASGDSRAALSPALSPRQTSLKPASAS